MDAVLLAAIAIAGAVALAIAGQLDAGAVSALLGVIVGSTFTVVADIVRDERERRFRLSIAGLDRRMAAHQEAYSRWYKIMRSIHRDDLFDILQEAREWWTNNSLYLQSESREAFSNLIRQAGMHKELNLNRRLEKGDKRRQAIQDVNKNWEEMERVGDVIADAVNLPGLDESEILGLSAPEET